MRGDASELQSLLYYVSLFWAVVYLLYYVSLRLRQQHLSSSVLPIPSSASRGVTRNLYKSPSTQITLHRLSLRIQSTVFNTKHDSLTETLSMATWSRVRNGLVHFYDLGSILGLVGMLGSLLLLMWTAGHIFRFGFWNNSDRTLDDSVTISDIRKRAFESYVEYLPRSEISAGTTIPVQMIVSGYYHLFAQQGLCMRCDHPRDDWKMLSVFPFVSCTNDDLL